MASVFTYDPDPPRVSSPWSTWPNSTVRPDASEGDFFLGGLLSPQPILLANCGITKLEAEPQEGPTEYKLHLLLRPRRSFSSQSTGNYVSGSYQSRSNVCRSESTAPVKPGLNIPVPPPTAQSRQNRLQQLTTQLLWRLQQSSPYHSSSTANLVLPVLPEAALKLGTPPRPGRLLPGLEESHGALYEIGVSDDGTFVGITRDELDESLMNLRAMAASLGCRVEILRTVVVGECELSSSVTGSEALPPRIGREKLLVVEVHVLPDMHTSEQYPLTDSPLTSGKLPSVSVSHEYPDVFAEEESQSEQLRVSLTGSTTSGKSSLLGTLSTSTLDNGRGKSRLSLLKHRHEIASGVTSSVALELLGYRAPSPDPDQLEQRPDVVNYGYSNVSSWNDIHNSAERGRLVFLTDSAGHPRYRRTTARGLVSWAPHWTLCCVAADDSDDSPGKTGSTVSAVEVLGPAGVGIDLSKAHLDLCLRLELSLVVIITKYDLASKTGLRQMLARVLSTVKAAGRQPYLLTPSSLRVQESDLQTLHRADEDEVKAMLRMDTSTLVPIVITSAVTGSGIGQLHALLRHLPILRPETNIFHIDTDEYDVESRIETLFHVDEVFTKSDHSVTVPPDQTLPFVESTFILSGHLRYGNLSIGDTLYVGPFAADTAYDNSRLDMRRTWSSPRQASGSPRSFNPSQVQQRPIPGDCPNGNIHEERNASYDEEWNPVRVISIRNLRLPVHKLSTGQVGTIGIEFEPATTSITSKPRKGMVLARPASGRLDDSPHACSGFKALFDDADYLFMEPGQLFSTYIASIRASAKIVSVEAVAEAIDHDSEKETQDTGDADDIFGFGENRGNGARASSAGLRRGKKLIEVAFHFVTYREWLEVGTRVLVMPGSGAEGSVGLEGFVGRITRGLE
ncbi:hypothetical protein MMC34_005095 [Xylographa carneopallida]|nr:hypothetical protein [Xylographa carneopallida]